nr:reverse transcriptase domain-containing protein [Tanacetum cinerariifolium]
MSTRSTYSNLFSPLRDPESLIRRRNLGEPSSLFDFEEVMNNNHNNQGPPPARPPPPQNNNGLPLVVRPNGPVPRTMEELCQPHRETINAAAKGTFMQKTPKECYNLIENITAHHNHWDTLATRDKTSRSISTTTTTTTTTTTKSPKVVRQLELMNKNFQEMMRQMQPVKAVNTCKTCGGPHSYTECPVFGGYTQEAPYATTGNYNSRGNSYQQQGDHNLLSYHSNNYLGLLSFNQPNVQNNQNRYNQNQGYNQNRGKNFNQGNNNYQALNNQVQVQPSNELSNYMKINETNMRAMQNQITNMRTEMRNDFETSMTKNQNELKNMMRNELKNIMSGFLQMQNPSGSGSLSSNTVANPRGDLKAITTRSGVSYDGPTISPTPSPLSKEVEHETEATKDKTNPKPSIPYPLRLDDQNLYEKANNQMLKFLQIFQRLHFDVSFPDALLYMPKFASTFKSLLSNKEKLFELASTSLNKNCSAVLLKKLPEKRRDPDQFLIPCDFQKLEECLALADLGASINLMPLSIQKKLSLPELTPTRMTIQLANRSVVKPIGDLLRTTRALIDVHGEELTLRVSDEAVSFKVGHTSRYFCNYYDETVHQINVIDVAYEEYAQEVLGFSDSYISGNPTPSDPIIASSSLSLTPFEGSDFILGEIETFLRTPDELSNINDDYYDTEGDILYLEKLLNEDPSPNLPLVKNDDLKQVDVTISKPSIEEPPKLELKDLPSHLEYAFLEGTNKLPVIISKELIDEEKDTLLKVLKSHKRAIMDSLDIFKFPLTCKTKKRQPSLALMGAENLVTDHLSRLDNPHEGDLEKKEINETFPLETLGVVSSCSDSSTYGPFLSSRGNKYILVAADYLSKWVEAKTLPTNDARVVVKFLKSLFARFGTSQAKLVIVALNHGLKRILERIVGENQASWSDKLDDALWAFRTAFKTPIGCTPSKLVYEKAFHLPIELEHKAYWALKHCNFDLKTKGDHRKVRINELNELRDQAYENSLIYKEKTKKIHDSKIKNRIFNVGDRVFPLKSRLKIFSGKLKTRWTRPFTVAQVFPNETVELTQTDGPNFKVNGDRLKHYFGGDIPPMVFLDLQTFPMDH